MILLLLLACGPAPQSRNLDAMAYVDASLSDVFVEGLQICQKIEDDALRAECTAFQVQRHGRQDPEVADKACQELLPGLWRDECYFLLAEALTMPAQPAPAARACQHSGRYFQPCLMHLLSAHAGHLRGTLPPEEVPAAYSEALLLAGDSPPSDFPHRAWSLLFRSQAESAPVLDPRACEELEDYGPPCRSGIREALSRALQKAMREAKEDTRAELCDIAPPNAETLAAPFAEQLKITIQPHPVLNAPIEQWHKTHCSKGH